MAPSLTGRGWGWVGFLAAEAVSQFPGPPLEDPPTSPPRKSTGALWGERGGTTGARAATFHGRRSVAADIPACLTQRLQRSRPNTHEQRRPCGRRATKRAKGERLARRLSRCEHCCTPVFSGPASGLAVTGVAIWPAPHRAERSAATCKPVSSPSGASFTRSVKETGPAIPGTGQGRCCQPPPLCRPDRVRVRDGSPSGSRRRTWQTARRAAQQPGDAWRGHPLLCQRRGLAAGSAIICVARVTGRSNPSHGS
jgi:hypothetical protein